MRTIASLTYTLCIVLASPLALAVEQFSYRVISSKPQDRSHFVQGLQIVDDYLYVSTGRYGESRLLRYHWPDQTLDQERPLDPRLFGEGVTVLGDRVYQLTWRSGLLFTYQRDTLEVLAVSRIPTEGWGLTHNGKELVLSDGSNRLYFIDPAEQRVTQALSVTESGLPVRMLNELEWIGDAIWANVYNTDRIVIIDPATGNVTGSIDLSGLLPVSERLPETNVLNGIAQDPRTGALWVTGKLWPYLYQIELVPAPTDSDSHTDEKTR
jgi:glutamine cyclotransferase